MQNQSWYAGIIYKNKKKKTGRKVSASIHHIQICILRTDKKTQGIQEKRATFTQLIEYNRLTFLVFVYIGTTPSTPQYPHKSKNSLQQFMKEPSMGDVPVPKCCFSQAEHCYGGAPQQNRTSKSSKVFGTLLTASMTSTITWKRIVCSYL